MQLSNPSSWLLALLTGSMNDLKQHPRLKVITINAYMYAIVSKLIQTQNTRVRSMLTKFYIFNLMHVSYFENYNDWLT